MDGVFSCCKGDKVVVAGDVTQLAVLFVSLVDSLSSAGSNSANYITKRSV